jgi:hypothetical protein
LVEAGWAVNVRSPTTTTENPMGAESNQFSLCGFFLAQNQFSFLPDDSVSYQNYF